MSVHRWVFLPRAGCYWWAHERRAGRTVDTKPSSVLHTEGVEGGLKSTGRWYARAMSWEWCGVFRSSRWFSCPNRQEVCSWCHEDIISICVWGIFMNTGRGERKRSFWRASLNLSFDQWNCELVASDSASIFVWVEGAVNRKYTLVVEGLSSSIPHCLKGLEYVFAASNWWDGDVF